MCIQPLPRTFLAALALCLPFFSGISPAAVFRVDQRATGSANGSSWPNAFPNLQDALAAATGGDEIWIAKGVYFPDEGVGYTDNDRSHSFVIPDGLTVVGGFAGWEPSTNERSPDVLKTVLSGDIEQNDLDSDGNGIAESSGDIVGSNSLHVVTVTSPGSAPKIFDLVITAGSADSGVDTHGGGMFVQNASPTISNLTFIGNRCTGRGGGLHVDGGSPGVQHCRFSGNSTTARGGAVGTLNGASPHFLSCEFKGNFAPRGGALNINASTPQLTNCTLSGNRASINGGAIQVALAATTLTLKNTLVWDNLSGGATNATHSSIGFFSGASASYEHCLLQNIDLTATGTGNLDGTDPLNDPLFETPADPASAPGTAGVLRLERDTPLVDLGSTGGSVGTSDIEWGLRRVDADGSGIAEPDLGAYELGRVIHVDDTATGAGDGTSWANAFTSLFDAVATNDTGDEIRVAEGIYYPDEGVNATAGARFNVFQLTSGVHILGGYPDGGGAERDPQLYVTILSGDIDQDDDSDLGVTRSTGAIVGANSYHVVRVPTSTPGAVLDGFVITGGQADFTTAGHINQKGGGVWFQGSATIRNCHLIGNHAEDEGGAAYFEFSSGAFEDCRFEKNFSGDDAGAIYVESAMPRVAGCEFIENASQDDGGAMLINDGPAMITDSCFRGNVATFTPLGDGAAGGAIFIRGASPHFSRCAFIGNRASTYQGGAIFCRSSGGSTRAVWENCVFSGNHATTGGAFFFILTQTPEITNCTITGNQATSSGGGLHLSSTSAELTITNTIIHNNMENGATATGGATKVGGDVSFRNSIVHNSGGSGGWTFGGSTDLGGNLDVDPRFLESVDPADAPTPWGDVRLLPGSPAVGAGDNAAQPPGTDIAGVPRLHGAVIDIGAFEQGDLIYVDDFAPGVGDGSSWADAYGNLQDGFSSASPGDLILVAEGLYRPDFGVGQTNDDPASTYQLVDAVAVLGGYEDGGTGARDPSAFLTTLSGDVDKNDLVDADGITANGSDIVGANAYSVVTATGAGKYARLDGFTITAGDGEPHGGGLLNLYGKATVAKCRFVGNSCGDQGAGIWDGDGLTIVDCLFTGGTAPGTDGFGHGGAVYTFIGATTRFLRCAFRDNFADIGAGGVHTHFHSGVHLSNCEFVGNEASYGAGFDNDSGSPTLVNCSFSGNNASVQGGAVINWDGPASTLTNCVIWNNIQSGSGSSLGASINRRSSERPTLINCLIANTGGSGAFFPTADLVDGGGNLDTDPLFILPGDPVTAPNDTGDLRLAFGSPAVDAGLNSASDSPVDLDLAERIQGGTIDLGAYEGVVIDDDTDDDGIPDFWERSHTAGGSNTDLDPASDGDGDNVTAMEEFFFGLDPGEANVPEDYSELGEVASFLTISFPMNPAATPYLDFLVERSTDLGVTDSWDPETAMWSSAGGWMSYRSTVPMPQQREFLRVTISEKP